MSLNIVIQRKIKHCAPVQHKQVVCAAEYYLT